MSTLNNHRRVVPLSDLEREQIVALAKIIDAIFRDRAPLKMRSHVSAIRDWAGHDFAARRARRCSSDAASEQA